MKLGRERSKNRWGRKTLGKNEGKENCERGKGKIKIKGIMGGKFKKKLLKAWFPSPKVDMEINQKGKWKERAKEMKIWKGGKEVSNNLTKS